MKISSIVFAVFTLLATQAQALDIGKSKIIDYQNQAVGSIWYEGKEVCKAFATSENEVITGRHCVTYDYDFEKYKFLISGDFLEIEAIQEMFLSADIVKLKLSANVAHYLELSSEAPRLHEKTLLLVSESQAQSRGAMKKAGHGAYFHTFSTDFGLSGAPIIQDGKVVAVHLGHTLKPIDSNGQYNVAMAVADLESANVNLGAGDYVFEMITKAKPFAALASKVADKALDKLIDLAEKKLSWAGPGDKKRWTQSYDVAAKGTTRCTLSGARILDIADVSGWWQGSGALKVCGKDGYDPEYSSAIRFRSNVTYNWFCLLSDESSSSGTPVEIGRYISGNKSQIIFWPNTTSIVGRGALKVTLTCEET